MGAKVALTVTEESQGWSQAPESMGGLSGVLVRLRWSWGYSLSDLQTCEKSSRVTLLFRFFFIDCREIGR